MTLSLVWPTTVNFIVPSLSYVIWADLHFGRRDERRVKKTNSSYKMAEIEAGGYRLEHFHMNSQEAIKTQSIDMTMGLLSDDDDWPCCMAAGCSPVMVQNENTERRKALEEEMVAYE